MAEEEHDCNCPPEGLPQYMGTFADLMALLMCFFVLLLSFAEMDVLKFKRLAGSMKSAFGVQREVDANQIPMGTSIIAQEFSPGRPEPTPINAVMQRTAEEIKENLQVQCTPELDTQEISVTQDRNSGEYSQFVAEMARLINETREDAVEIANALAKQISEGQVEVETRGREITVRIKEKGSFASGSAQLKDGYELVLHDVRDVLAKMKGMVLVQGHTDNISISTSRFRSNWELSAARAVSVAEQLLYEDVLDPQRFTVSGFSYTRPLVENSTDKNRAINRRVEIVINQELDEETRKCIDGLEEESPETYRQIDIKLSPRFDIAPEEVF